MTSLASLTRWAAPLRQAARCLHTPPQTPSSTSAALQLIRSQPSQYVVANFVGKNYILTPRDLLTVPHLRDVKVHVEATVVEHTKGSMEIKFKKKRRKGYQKTIKRKHPFTRLRIGNIIITPEPDAAAQSIPASSSS